ncbi:LPS-assembly protein [Candidatus Blochmanniella vafra str. BVAF]|uniref:LPS-assembly protein LptD n=1 Tax=Blochmanniella vafra (strain BVAF) TaxID=859654 RepID=E8Q5P0_BLOVB|nr:LPS assembly protein LptD [Candidatus Blochmannia vafer]ADV33537.1 LPS-assembly protein [Candidatus Blochmannia vafer str. BVAF]
MSPQLYCKIQLINLIWLILYTQISLAHNSPNNSCHLHTSQILQNNNSYSNTFTTIHTQSDRIEINYPQNIQFIGNVNIQHNDNIVKSDKLTIFYYRNNHELYHATTLFADGNVHYHNNSIQIEGSSAQFDLNNKKNKFHNSKYHIYQPNIYGKAKYITQIKHNHYIILNQGGFTTCTSNTNSWYIRGSKIIYDHYTNNIDIWNAYLTIKNIPIFYSPYLSFSLNNKNILESYIPNIKHSAKHGLILKIPYPLIFSKYYSGIISPYYSSNSGIKLQTKIHYFFKLGSGSITADIISDNITQHPANYYSYNNILSKLYWKHNGFIYKKWYCNINYVSNNNSTFSSNNNTIQKKTKLPNDFIDQKIFFYYNNKHYKLNIAYLGNSNFHTNQTIKNNYFTYIASPQLELYIHFNIYKKLFYFQIFNQFSRFIPSHYLNPTSIRIHTEPKINFTINNPWIKFNAETKLKITHYQQNNINYYNNQKHKMNHLQNKVSRIIPQLKIQGSMIFQQKTNISKKYKHFLEPKLQYLYTPYYCQRNIGIYDTKFIHMTYNNLFHDSIYSGLDRIAPANQIKSTITARCFKKRNELFYISVGNLFNINQQKKVIYHNYDANKTYCHPYTSKFLLLSGIGHWNINNYWNIHSETQFHIPINKFSFSNLALEYNNTHHILQINYRYINSKYLKNTPILHNPLLYYQTISQIGTTIYYPLLKNWKISYSQHHNLKFNYIINQTIGIQRITPCWIISILFERKITDWNKTLNTHSYDKKIQFYFKINNSKSKFYQNPYKLLQSSMIPYINIYNINYITTLTHDI